MLTRWNTGTNTRDILARIIKQGKFTDGTWQPFSFPFTYFNSPSPDPDSCFIVVRSSINTNPSTSTILNIDNFAMEALDGVQNYSIKNAGTSIYPNPVKSNATLTYELKKDANVTINIIDLTGKVVLTLNTDKTAGKQQEILELGELKSGLYFYEIKSSDEVKTGKFTISK